MKSPSKCVPQMLTIRATAERLGVCTKTIYRWIQSGEIHVHRYGRTLRISEEDATQFAAARRQ